MKGAKEKRLLEMGIKPIWFPPKDYEMGESILKTAIANARRRVTI